MIISEFKKIRDDLRLEFPNLNIDIQYFDDNGLCLVISNNVIDCDLEKYIKMLKNG